MKVVLNFLYLIGFILSSVTSEANDNRFGPEIEFRSKNQGKYDIGCMLLNPLSAYGIYEATKREEGTNWAFAGYTVLSPLAWLVTSTTCSGQISKIHKGRLAAALKAKCAEFNCKVEVATNTSSHTMSNKNVYRFTFDDGWYFQVDADISAVEIQAKPVTHTGYKAKKELMDNFLYKTAREIGLDIPKQDWLSGGHISIGFKENFKGNPKLFRNFIVDQLNHLELSSGIHLNDKINAKPPNLNKKMMKKIREVIDDFDSGKLPDEDEFIKKLHKVMKDSSAIDFRTLLFGGDERKRIEVRAHRSQKSMDEFLDLIHLYDKRIEYLSRLEGVIPFDPPTEELSKERMIIRYKDYVEESGLPFERYFNHLPENYKEVGMRLNLGGISCLKGSLVR